VLSNDVLTLRDSGNVGIGTTNPTSFLTAISPWINYSPSLTFRSTAAYSFETAGVELAAGVAPAYPYAYWLQAREYGNNAWTLSLNPLGGNVGIGTISPTYKLDVAGQIRSSSGGVVFPDGSTQMIAYTQVASGNNVITQVNGNVGIGTTTPSAALQVIGDIVVGQNNNGGTNKSYSLWIETEGAATNNNYTSSLTSVAGDGVQPANSALQIREQNWNGSAYVQNPVATFVNNGNVGIGTTSPSQLLEVNGTAQVDGSLNVGNGGIVFPNGGGTQTVAYTGVTCGGDYAESVNVAGNRTNYEPGDVLVIDPSAPGKFLKANQAYSTLVAGIYSTKPGTVGRRQTTAKSPDEVPMAMVGIVPTKVSAENGPIKTGDLLVASSTLGRAMKGTDRSLLTGAVIGKALGSLDSGTGVIEVLVTLQ
jgi:hypothetical protein